MSSTIPNESLLLKNISRGSRDALDEKPWNEIADQIRDAIETSVVPAYRKFADFLKQEYLPACRGPIACRGDAGWPRVLS